DPFLMKNFSTVIIVSFTFLVTHIDINQSTIDFYRILNLILYHIIFILIYYNFKNVCHF
ncbi:MAG: hypothetical protein RL188_828, partial [Bacteroidota bacterium]